jgi:hypothetical protein
MSECEDISSQISHDFPNTIYEIVQAGTYTDEANLIAYAEHLRDNYNAYWANSHSNCPPLNFPDIKAIVQAALATVPQQPVVPVDPVDPLPAPVDPGCTDGSCGSTFNLGSLSSLIPIAAVAIVALMLLKGGKRK